jgi:hypothetical protein
MLHTQSAGLIVWGEIRLSTHRTIVIDAPFEFSELIGIETHPSGLGFSRLRQRPFY